jgi:hypothetical protein
VVEAHYFGESDEASAADRYVFFGPYTASRLFLRPGRYRLHALSVDGSPLSDQVINVVSR